MYRRPHALFIGIQYSRFCFEFRIPDARKILAGRFFGNLSKTNISNETLLIALIMSSVYGIVFTSIGAIIHKRQTI